MFFQLEISERFMLSSSAQDLWDLQIHEESPVIGTINLLSAEIKGTANFISEQNYTKAFEVQL